MSAVSEGLLLVKDSIAIGVFQNLNPTDRIVRVLATCLIVEILGNPQSAAIVETEGDRFGNVGLGRED